MDLKGDLIESFLYCIQEKDLGSCGNAGKLRSWREKTVAMFDEAPAAAPPQAEPHQTCFFDQFMVFLAFFLV
jgi:hypothetical protein